jgi:hypothetical protein
MYFLRQVEQRKQREAIMQKKRETVKNKIV